MFVTDINPGLARCKPGVCVYNYKACYKESGFGPGASDRTRRVHAGAPSRGGTAEASSYVPAVLVSSILTVRANGIARRRNGTSWTNKLEFARRERSTPRPNRRRRRRASTVLPLAAPARSPAPPDNATLQPPGLRLRDRDRKRWPLNTVLIVNSNNRTTIEVVNNRM